MKKNSKSQTNSFGFEVLDFPSLEFILAAFVSDFDIRISNLLS